MRILAVIVILIAFLFGLAAWRPWDLERENVAAVATPAPGGHFETLPSGRTHVVVAGKDDAPTVVLVHGASGPLAVWTELTPRLVAAGLRVVSYDLYGRGLSDRPDADYDLALYDAQLSQLIDSVAKDREIVLVGSSMGCIIAANYATKRPGNVASVVLMGPAGFPIEASPLSGLLGVPVVGRLVMGAVGDRMLARHNRAYLAEPDEHQAVLDAYVDQFRYRGTKEAIRSTMLRMPMQDFSQGYAAFAATMKPTLLLWGKKDVTFPFSHHVKAQELMPRAEFVELDNAAHLPQVEEVDRVAKEIARFVVPPVAATVASTPAPPPQMAAPAEMQAAIREILAGNIAFVDAAAVTIATTPGAGAPFAENRLALIAPLGSKEPAGIKDLLAPPVTHVAVIEPARDALTKLGFLAKLEKKLAFEPNAAAVVDAVAGGKAEAGIVYLSDARASSDKVRLAMTLSETSHTPVVYSITPPDAPLAGMLKTQAARDILLAHGFLPKD